MRILSRLTANDKSFTDSGSASKSFAPLATAVLNRDEPSDHNQAMMELGATVCHRRSPLCTICPVRRHCAGSRNGDPESYPRLAPKKIKQVAITRGWCVQKGNLLLHRIPAGAKRLAGQYELPSSDHLPIAEEATVITTKKRSITKYRITETIREIAPPSLLPDELHWVSFDDLSDITLSGPHRRWITELLD